MQQNEFFHKNYKRLYSSIKKLPKQIKEMLINQTYLEMERKWDTIKNLPEEELIGLTCRTMYNQYQWENSNYNKAQTLWMNTNIEFTIDFSEQELKQVINSEQIELLAEGTSKLAVDWLIDLQSRYTKEQIERLIDIQLVLHTLKPHEKVLYNMYFLDGDTVKEISEKIKLNKHTTTKMINTIKDKIKKNIKKLNEKN